MITDKIKKLLRLAGQKDNANEASAAFGHAQRLATLHGLNLDDLLVEDATEVNAGAPVPRDVQAIERRWIVNWNKAVAWKLSLVSALTSANGCGCCYTSGHGGGATAYGQPRDLDVVSYMYAAISREVDRLARDAVRSHGGPQARSYGRSFRIGCVAAIARKLRDRAAALAESRETVNNARALAVQANDSHALAVSTTALARVCAATDYQERADAAVSDFKASMGLRKGADFAGARGGGYSDGRRAGRGVNVGSGGVAALGPTK